MIENHEMFKVVIARYRFSLDSVKTLHTYYLTLLECMCKVSELLTTRNSKKLSLNKNLLYTGFPTSQEKSTLFLIAVNKSFLPCQRNLFVR